MPKGLCGSHGFKKGGAVKDIGKSAFNPQRSTMVCDSLKADPEFLFPSFGNPLEKELIVKSAKTGEVGERIRAYIGLRQNSLPEIYRGCFDEKWNFDYARFDDAFEKSVSPFIMACYAAYRLKNPPEPEPSAKGKIQRLSV